MRIALIGNSGSGKSTLPHQLAAAHALPMLDLDTVAVLRGMFATDASLDAGAQDLSPS